MCSCHCVNIIKACISPVCNVICYLCIFKPAVEDLRLYLHSLLLYVSVSLMCAILGMHPVFQSTEKQ